MRREEIDLVYAAGREAVGALIAAQAARIEELVARVEELERQAGRNSRNSSLPPSRDSSDARKARPKKRSGRRQGGQPGHPGRHRELVADPDRMVEHWPLAPFFGTPRLSASPSRGARGGRVGRGLAEAVRVRVEVVGQRGPAAPGLLAFVAVEARAA